MVKNITFNDGNSIPQLGYGVWQIEDNGAADAVGPALEAGYRHIDTASIYGNEVGVGRGIAASSVPREDIFLTTKLWNSDQGFEKAISALDASLERLGTDYVDLYLIHWPVTKDYADTWQSRIKETWKAMEKLYKEGKIKAIGVSNFLVHHLEELMSDCEIKPMVDQIEFHPGHNQKETVEFCKKHGIIVEAWSPLGRGVILENEFLSEVAQKYNKTIAQICLRWIIQQEVVALPKSVTPERIKSNFEVFNFELSEEDMDRITNMGPAGYTGSDPNLGRY